MSPNNGQKFYNIKEACKFLGINRTTFARWLEIGLIPPGYPISPKSQRRLWTKQKLDKVEMDIHKMVVYR